MNDKVTRMPRKLDRTRDLPPKVRIQHCRNSDSDRIPFKLELTTGWLTIDNGIIRCYLNEQDLESLYADAHVALYEEDQYKQTGHIHDPSEPQA